MNVCAPAQMEHHLFEISILLLFFDLSCSERLQLNQVEKGKEEKFTAGRAGNNVRGVNKGRVYAILIWEIEKKNN